ncbi:MAG: hypothetical protein QOG10_5416 [Kribbellaceae bacterium]|nr:hypothetical protein [Kribbellaceae bacterium]
MRSILLTSLTAAALLAGCSENKPAPVAVDPPTPTPTATPKKVFPKLPVQGKPLPVKLTKAGRPLLQSDGIDYVPSLNESRSITAQVIAALRKRTEYLAGYKAKSSGRCEGGRVKMAADANTLCTVTYQGVKVEWVVSISHDYKPDSSLAEYEMYPIDAALLAEAVYSAYWKQYHEDGAELRCGKIPEISVVRHNEPTPYRCQQFDPQDNTVDPPRPPRWLNYVVSIGDYGVTFDPT